MNGIENNASSNSSIIGCVFIAAVTFLPKNSLATIVEGSYELRR
jgi:hypothetical protein